MLTVFKNLFRQSVKRDTFINNVTTMVSGNIIAQSIALAAAPIITRIYSPYSFGIMVYLTSIVNILSVAGNLRYESAIVLPKKDTEANQLFLLCILSALCISSLLYIIVILYNNFICKILGKEYLKSWLWIVPLGVFITSSFKALTFMHARHKSFLLLSISRIAVSISGAGIKIILGFFIGPSVAWLITGNIISPVIALIILGYSLFIQIHLDLKPSLINKIKTVAFKYSKFPKYYLPTGLLNVIGQNLPILLFAYFYQQDVVGYYGLANSILRRPISIMAESFSKVFLQKSAEDQNAGKTLKKPFIKGTLGLATLGIIPFATLALTGKWLFSLLFGENWGEAGLYVQILAPWLFMAFINVPSTQIIITKQALKFNLLFNIYLLFTRGIVIIVGYNLFSTIYDVLILFSLSSTLFNVFYIYYAFKLVNYN